MPIHDWTRVKAGTYHNFHYRWIAATIDRLNTGLLPPGYFAMAEQVIGKPEADVVTLQLDPKASTDSRGPVAVRARPRTKFVLPIPSDAARYARKANRIAIRHELGD